MSISMPAPLRGIIPPLVTPLKDADELDVAGFERLIENIVGAGCAGIFVLGTTGEAQALSYERRLEVVRLACQFVRGRVPVLAGVSDTSVAESIALGLRVKEIGVPRVYLDPSRSFGPALDDPAVRLAHYREVLARAEARFAAPAVMGGCDLVPECC